MFILKVEEFDGGRDDLYLEVKGEKHELFIYEDSVVIEYSDGDCKAFPTLIDALKAMTADIKPTSIEEFIASLKLQEARINEA